MTTETGTFTPTDEDVERAVRELLTRLVRVGRSVDYLSEGEAERLAERILATIGPIIERERRAAKAEAVDRVRAHAANFEGAFRQGMLRAADQIEHGG